MNAIIPLAEELKNDLMEINFVTLTADTSNQKDVKLISVMVRLTRRPVLNGTVSYFHLILSVPTFCQMSRFSNHFVKLFGGLVKTALI